MGDFKEFLKKQLGREQPPIYVPIRLLSVSMSWHAARLGVSPNTLTGLGLMAALTAAVMIASGQPNLLPGGAAFIALAYIFDCMDGEVARCRQVSSHFGSQLDQLSNWITLVALQIAMAIGAFKITEDPAMLIWGIFSVAGWCTFYYLYLQMVIWIPSNGKFTLLRILSRILFILMPLDENLVIAFVLLGRLDIGILVTAIIGVTLSILVVGLYIFYMHSQLKEPAKQN